jgi:hypothetical protein
MIAYNKEAIDKVSSAILGDASALQELLKGSHPELAAVASYFANHDEEAFAWLMKNRLPLLAAFAKAADGDKKAFTFLMKSGNHLLAATANASSGDKKARQWLEMHGYSHYALLAQNIEAIRKKRDSDFTGLLH